MRLLDELAVIVNCAVSGGILHESAKSRACVPLAVFISQARGMRCSEVELAEIADHYLDTTRLGACLKNGNGLWVTIVGNEKHTAVRRDRMTQRHRFSRGSGFVKERSVGDLEGGEIRDHRLKIEESLEPALRELRLIGRVSSVPTWVFENVSLDDRWGDAIVIAGSDEGARDLVLPGNRTQLGQRFHLRLRFWQVQFSIQANISWNGGIGQ